MLPYPESSIKKGIERFIEFTRRNSSERHDEIKASVVIVAYKTNWELIKCLDSLKDQSFFEFETIIVDNGGNEAIQSVLYKYPIIYIRLKNNYKPSLARNLGIAHARGEIICFLDDDAIAHQDFVKQHVLAHQQRGVLGVRGKILPKTNSLYNCLAYQYDLGSKPVPSYIDQEGNASYRRKVLMEVGGFNPRIFAGEGVELSYRIVKRFGEPKNLIYWPEAIIYHDFSTNLSKYLRKTIRGVNMHVLLEQQNPALWDFVESYHPFLNSDTARPLKLSGRIKLAALRRGGWLLERWCLNYFRRRQGRCL